MIRKIFYAAILGLALYYLFTHREELQAVLDVFGQGDWRWMLAALGAQFVWMIVIAAALQATYRLVGVSERIDRLVPLTTAANFVNTVAPSYGAGALAVLIADGHQRDKPAARVSTGAILYLVYDYIGFMIVLSIGLVILHMRGVLDPVLIAASAFAVTIGVSLIIMAILGIQSAKKLGNAVHGLTRFANRLLHPILKRNLIDDARAKLFSLDLSDGLQHVRREPLNLLIPAGLALTRKIMMMVILLLVSIAFRHPLSLDTLIAVFTTSYLFTIASITPSGVGFVEGAMTVYLSELNVPIATAAVISLAYRGLTFWLILAYGVIAIRWIGYDPRKPKTSSALAANPAPNPGNDGEPWSDSVANPETSSQSPPPYSTDMSNEGASTPS